MGSLPSFEPKWQLGTVAICWGLGACPEQGCRKRGGSVTTEALPVGRSPFMAGVQTLPCPSLSFQDLDEFRTTRLQPGCKRRWH
ncbi:hypothetical protein D3C77_107400 [compost metagenome]